VTTARQPNPDFRPDPDRAVFLTGQITQGTLDQIGPTILRLQFSSRQPITLYIDSPGGETRSAEALNNLLRAGTQDSALPCRLITVATTTAASAAADLLAGADYALAYPYSRILFHGVRQGADVLTREEATLLAQRMASYNENFALELARNCIFRFIFRVVLLRPEFHSIRERENNLSLSDSQCMTFALQDRVSPGLRDLLLASFDQSVEIETRDAYVAEKLRAYDLGTLPEAEFGVLVFKSILDYELELLKQKNYPPWSLTQSFGDIEDKFLLLIDMHQDHHNRMIRMLCERWGEFFLAPAEGEGYESKTEGDRTDWLLHAVEGRLRPIWFFFVSICRQLQKQDYWLSSADAYWLGLIDEVIGRDDLSNLRIIAENAPPTPG
jgi:ATP-dependent protease ClpP protease subunit